MSWFSKAANWVGGAAKTVAQTALSVVQNVAMPVISSVVGSIPVIGGFASKFTDVLGNKVFGGIGSLLDGGGDAGSNADQYVQAAQSNNLNFSLSNPAVNVPPQQNYLAAAGGVLSGLGIGDGKKGLFGIGTGKNKAKKAAQAAVLAAGGTEATAKAAGERAALEVEQNGIPSRASVRKAATNAVLLSGGTQVQADAAGQVAADSVNDSDFNSSASGGSSIGLMAAAAAAALLLLL